MVKKMVKGRSWPALHWNRHIQRPRSHPHPFISVSAISWHASIVFWCVSRSHCSSSMLLIAHRDHSWHRTATKTGKLFSEFYLIC